MGLGRLMATRKRKSEPEPEAPGPVALRPGMPTRLLPHDWPFLYSVIDNGDLVINKRLQLSKPKATNRPRIKKSDDALM